MSKSIYILLFLSILLTPMVSRGQLRMPDNTRIGDDGSSDHWGAPGDSTDKSEKIPIGIKAWTVEPRFGTITPTDPDTLPHLFQNDAFTEGRTGRYNTTGNLGAPRMSRVFTDNVPTTFASPFLFAAPYDFFLTSPGQLLYTNTRSPFTNITYHECGNKENGEDRIRGIFSTNVNKRMGLGFKLDYLYGRGYYASQSTAHFNGTLFASYRGERYDLHAHLSANHLKNSENGGIESDDYITRPEIFPTKYGPADMPTRLTKAWNKLNVNRLYLNHRYSFGFMRFRDAEGRIVKSDSMATGGGMLASITGGQSAVSDTAKVADTTSVAAETLPEELVSEYVPVAGLIHTMQVESNDRRFLSNATANVNAPGYFIDFYLPGDSAADLTRYMAIDNQVALELREGFNRWAKAGLRLYARHRYDHFTLPTLEMGRVAYNENHFTLGAQIKKEQGRILRYDLLGELRTTGSNWGEFSVEGHAALDVPLRDDTLALRLNGFVRNEEPTFYLRHFHARNAWWDNTGLNKEFRARAAATLSYKRTRINFAIESIQNMAYLAERQQPYTTGEGLPLARYGIGVEQTGKNLQVMELTLGQDFRLGILNWENELTYQLTSDDTILPLPAFTAYTNLYLLFRLAKVLRTEIGADARFFTEYYAPTYSPIMGQFCVQDPSQRIKVGGYPFVNVYANFHLKNTRFYVMASHANAKSGSGRPFLLPHYPTNGFVLRLGVSWNFFN